MQYKPDWQGLREPLKQLGTGLILAGFISLFIKALLLPGLLTIGTGLLFWIIAVIRKEV